MHMHTAGHNFEKYMFANFVNPAIIREDKNAKAKFTMGVSVLTRFCEKKDLQKPILLSFAKFNFFEKIYMTRRYLLQVTDCLFFLSNEFFHRFYHT